MKDKGKLKNKLKLILELFLTFLRIGAFTFGGGYAMISLVERDVVDKKKWLTSKEMLDIIAIAESTPGAIALNTATFVGAKVAGIFGSIVATFAVLFPSTVIITLISGVINEFGDNQYVKWAFMGIRAAVCALILNAVIKMSKFLKGEKRIVIYAVMAVSLTLALLNEFDVIKFDVIYIILMSAVFGIVWGIINRKIAKKKGATQEEVKEETSENVEEPPIATGSTKEPEINEEVDENADNH